jgi:hypothetical protein
MPLMPAIPGASVAVSPAPRATSATVDHVHADSVPSETRVSIVAVPWRALISAARWKAKPLTKTTGVARPSASHGHPSNISGGTIDTSTRGTVRPAARSRRQVIERRWRSATSPPASSSGTW